MRTALASGTELVFGKEQLPELYSVILPKLKESIEFKDIDEKHSIYLFEKVCKKLKERGHILFIAPGKITKNTLKVYQVI